MVEINDFVAQGSVEPEVLEAYRDRVPAEVVELWETYGYGTFGFGFLRVINPAEYESELGDCIGKTRGDGIAIPIMVTGLADLITWEPSVGFVAITYREDAVGGLSQDLTTFLEGVTLAKAAYLKMVLNWGVFPEAVEAHGELAYDESFVFETLPSQGGEVAADNLVKQATIPAIQAMVGAQGVIEH